MQTRFLHSADWQLGKPFASLDDSAKRYRLQQERIQAVQRMAPLVRETEAAFVLVAGDLFDSPHVTKATVSAACAAIGALTVPVLVIPGNHDHAGPGSIWEREFFRREQEQLAPNLQVLLKPEPVVLDSAIILPAPLLRRHEVGNPVAWIRQAVQAATLPPEPPRIVLAHGTVQSFGSTQEDEEDSAAPANWIDLSSLPSEDIDYIALGDWHGVKQVGPKAWYSGTPEIDRFPKGEGNEPGLILQVTATRGQPPQVVRLPFARLSWKRSAFRFTDDASLDLLASELDECIGAKAEDHLLHLALEGSLGIAAAARLEKLLESWEARLVRLKLESHVVIAPSEAEIGKLTCRTDDPLISDVAAKLVVRTLGDSEDAAIARLALRELHAVIA